LGAFLGVASHLALDGLVHPEMVPSRLSSTGYPIYADLMQAQSWVRAPRTVWLIVQCLGDGATWLRQRHAAVHDRN
jgi:hypothetical protein